MPVHGVDEPAVRPATRAVRGSRHPSLRDEHGRGDEQPERRGEAQEFEAVRLRPSAQNPAEDEQTEHQPPARRRRAWGAPRSAGRFILAESQAGRRHRGEPSSTASRCLFSELEARRPSQLLECGVRQQADDHGYRQSRRRPGAPPRPRRGTRRPSTSCGSRSGSSTPAPGPCAPNARPSALTQGSPRSEVRMVRAMWRARARSERIEYQVPRDGRSPRARSRSRRR